MSGVIGMETITRWAVGRSVEPCQLTINFAEKKTAVAKCEYFNNGCSARLRSQVHRIDVIPNANVRRYGLGRFQVLIRNCGSPWLVELRGTRDELLESGVAECYMFDQLGSNQTRSGPTEYGDSFTLRRMANGRFNLAIHFRDTASIPYGMMSFDLDSIDIGPILRRVSK